MHCIDVLRQLIRELRLEDCLFTLIEHEAGVNWRPRFRTVHERVRHVASSLEQSSPISSWSVTGNSIISQDFEPASLITPGEHRVVSVTSKVNCKGKIYHLALMNLHPEDGLTYEEMKIALKVVTQGMGGYLLESGRYYHFYGNSLLSERKWLEFLINFLMPTVLVSPRYIGHSLFRGYTCLRLTTDSTYKPVLPTVCDVL